MERFKEFNINNKDKKFSETEIEKKEIENVNFEEKKFFRKVKEYAKDIFHFATKENFEKALRIVALAAVLSAPVGEKAFAEREVNQEQTVVVAVEQQNLIDKKINEFKEIIKKIDSLKEEYGVEFVGRDSEFTLEELQDFDEALEKVQEFAPKQFSELKIVFARGVSFSGMQVFPNVSEKLDWIKDTILSYQGKDNDKPLRKMLNLQALLYKFQYNAQDKIDTKYNTAYDIILTSYGKIEKPNTIPKTVCGTSKNIRKSIYIHELSHLITINNPSIFEELSENLSEEFKRINKKIKNSKLTIYSINSMDNIKRYSGFVSAYAGKGDNLFYSSEYEYKESNTVYEDVAETMTYMINDYHFADDDEFVQEKIKAIKEFLSKKSND